jgi:hypothetical protein
VPLVVFAGKEYGTGSSRDWAAKGTGCSASRRDRRELRAHPPLQPGRHGRAAAAVRVEVGVLGNEGFTPIAVSAGLRSVPHQAIMQVSGDGFRMPASVMEPALASNPKLQTALNRYAALHGMQVAQTAGCNRLHDLEQRLSRWLLLTQDRVGSGLLKITHDFLAMMLGTDRPSVSLAAGALQKKKIIEYSHGAVKVLNRKKLESTACECYSTIQQFNGEMLLNPQELPGAAN